MIRGIICDVGHTITSTSVLNHILKRLGLTKPARVLYDMMVLESSDEYQIEQWVDSVIREKVNAMNGIRAREIEALATEVALTPGFAELVQSAHAKNIPVMLVGAVPTFVTNAMLRANSIFVDYVAGTRVTLSDGRIRSADMVCTPRFKASEADNWLRQISITPDQTLVIGDSIGDIPTMRLVPKKNRVGFNADHTAVTEFVGHNYRDSMHKLVEDFFNERTA
jgi:HAD superfamily phosphoserine phosphatase-like hydrolase